MCGRHLEGGKRTFLRFSGDRGQARGERGVRVTRDGRDAKKITPIRQPLFMSLS